MLSAPPRTAVALIVLVSLGGIALSRRLGGPTKNLFTPIGRGFCRDAHFAWPSAGVTGSCITKAACEAQCSGLSDCKGYAFAPKDEMGHCWPSGGPVRDIAKFDLKQDSGSELSRCVIYQGTEPIANAAVELASEKGLKGEPQPQWVLDTKLLYTCYSRSPRSVGRVDVINEEEDVGKFLCERGLSC